MEPEAIDGTYEIEVTRREGVIGLEQIFVALQDIDKASLAINPLYKRIELTMRDRDAKGRRVEYQARLESSMRAIEIYFDVDRKKLRLEPRV